MSQMQEMLKYGFPKTLGPFALVRARKLALFVDRVARYKRSRNIQNSA